jgi:hypothetical protein
VQAARKQLLADAPLQALLSELQDWPVRALKNHKDAGHPLHKLVFLADLGLRSTDPGVSALLERILAHLSPEGPFQVLLNISTHFGGSGQDEWMWSLCDAPLLLYVLVRFGLGQDARVQAAAQYLASLVRDNGWPCAATARLGKFHGPGRRDDPCPYANLVMLQALAQMPEWRDSAAVQQGAEAQLTLWARSREWWPYLFHAGTDFRKLKAPLLWYDIVHVLDVLTQFPWLAADTRVHEMVDVVTAKADAQGRYTAESVWKTWAEWEFGQKREPSRWITLLVLRTLKRLQD